jgi:hypothetical protein
MLRIYAPEILETIFRTFYVYHPQEPLSKVIIENKNPESVLSPNHREATLKGLEV